MYEEVLGLVQLVTLTRREYCVVRDPVDSDGKLQLGTRNHHRNLSRHWACRGPLQSSPLTFEPDWLPNMAGELRKGPANFFLEPGESLETGGIQQVHVLAEDEALLLRTLEQLEDVDDDGAPVKRSPGDRWMVYGPRDFIPAVEVRVLPSAHAEHILHPII